MTGQAHETRRKDLDDSGVAKWRDSSLTSWMQLDRVLHVTSFLCKQLDVKLVLDKNPILDHLLLDLRRRYLLTAEVSDDMNTCPDILRRLPSAPLCRSFQEVSKQRKSP